jgi:phage-related protein
MATFPDYKPRIGASKSSAPAVRTTKFGDGYEQRVRFGLNQDPKEWTLEWNVTEEVSLKPALAPSHLTGHHLIAAPATSGYVANGRRQ